jgi:hypothetical protein
MVISPQYQAKTAPLAVRNGSPTPTAEPSFPFRAPSAIRPAPRSRSRVVSRPQFTVSITLLHCRERGNRNYARSGRSFQWNYMRDRQVNRFPESPGQRDISQRERSRPNGGSETPQLGLFLGLAHVLAMPRASPTFAPLLRAHGSAQSRRLGPARPARSGAHHLELRPSPCRRGRAVRRHLRDAAPRARLGCPRARPPTAGRARTASDRRPAYVPSSFPSPATSRCCRSLPPRPLVRPRPQRS